MGFVDINHFLLSPHPFSLNLPLAALSLARAESPRNGARARDRAKTAMFEKGLKEGQAAQLGDGFDLVDADG